MRNGVEGGKDCTAGPRRVNFFAKEWERGKKGRRDSMSSESSLLILRGGLGRELQLPGSRVGESYKAIAATIAINWRLFATFKCDR